MFAASCAMFSFKKELESRKENQWSASMKKPAKELHSIEQLRARRSSIKISANLNICTSPARAGVLQNKTRRATLFRSSLILYVLSIRSIISYRAFQILWKCFDWFPARFYIGHPKVCSANDRWPIQKADSCFRCSILSSLVLPSALFKNCKQFCSRWKRKMKEA